MLVRDGVQFGVIGIDELALAPSAQAQLDHLEEVRQRGVSAPPRCPRVRHVEVRIDDALRGDDERVERDLVEKRGMIESRRWPQPALHERLVGGAHAEGQDRAYRIDFFEVHVPTGQCVLLRRQAGHECGDRGGGRRWEHRGQAAPQILAQGSRWQRVAQIAVAEAVDYQQQDAGRLAEQRGCKRLERRVRCRLPPAHGVTEGGHQVDDAAASVVG